MQRGGEQITLSVPLETVDLPGARPEDRRPHGPDRAAQLRRHRADGRDDHPARHRRARDHVEHVGQGGARRSSPCRSAWSTSMRQTFTAEERDREGIVGPVGIGRLSGEVVAEDSLPMKEKATLLLEPPRRAEPVPLPVQPHPAAPARRRPRRRRGVGGDQARAGRSSATSPTPARSTSPRRCPVTYVVSIALVLMGGLDPRRRPREADHPVRLVAAACAAPGAGWAGSEVTGLPEAPVRRFGDDGCMNVALGMPALPAPVLAERRKSRKLRSTTPPTRWRSAATPPSRCSR